MYVATCKGFTSGIAETYMLIPGEAAPRLAAKNSQKRVCVCAPATAINLGAARDNGNKISHGVAFHHAIAPCEFFNPSSTV